MGPMRVCLHGPHGREKGEVRPVCPEGARGSGVVRVGRLSRAR